MPHVKVARKCKTVYNCMCFAVFIRAQWTLFWKDARIVLRCDFRESANILLFDRKEVLKSH